MSEYINYLHRRQHAAVKRNQPSGHEIIQRKNKGILVFEIRPSVRPKYVLLKMTKIQKTTERSITTGVMVQQIRITPIFRDVKQPICYIVHIPDWLLVYFCRQHNPQSDPDMKYGFCMMVHQYIHVLFVTNEHLVQRTQEMEAALHRKRQG